MEIHETSGEASLQGGRWFLHGLGKAGKSTCASGWPNNLFLASERRLEHIPGVEYAFISTWEEFKSIVKELKLSKFKKRYEVITVDVVDHIWAYCVQDRCKKLGIDHQSDGGFGKAYDAIDKEFKDTFYRLLSYDYGIIIVSHTTMKEVITSKGTSQKYVSGLPERARKIIIPHMGVIGFVNFDTFTIKKNGKSKIIEGRSIQFQGDEDVEAGDGEGRLPKRLRLYKDATKTYAAIQKYYEQEPEDD